jgi:serine/threonine protein kinase
MVLALYVGRERFALRHFDVKLLNFFMKPIDTAPPVSPMADADANAAATSPPSSLLDGSPAGDAVAAEFVMGDMTFSLTWSASAGPASRLQRPMLVKLADYGTSETGAGGLGSPIRDVHFTTLENTAPELLALGSGAQQCFSSADSFALGLCMLHLFTGGGPYEETLSTVSCPPPLARDLMAVWRDPAASCAGAPFHCLARVAEDDQSLGVLVDTLYRYIVLTGLPDPDTNPAQLWPAAAGAGGSPVWLAVRRMLDPSWPAAGGRKATGSKQDAPKCQAQLKADRAQFSLSHGTSPALACARTRLSAVPGAMSLLLALLAYHPDRRPSMLEALRSPTFSLLRLDLPPARTCTRATPICLPEELSALSPDQLTDVPAAEARARVVRQAAAAGHLARLIAYEARDALPAV